MVGYTRSRVAEGVRKYQYKHKLFVGHQGSAVVSSAAFQQEGPGFESSSGPLRVEFACSPHVYVAFLWVHRFPPVVQLSQ